MEIGPRYDPANADQRLLILNWYRRIRAAQFAHSEAASQMRHSGARLGIPSVVLSVIVGSAVFASITEDPNIYLKILTGLCSMISAILAGLQIFLRYDDRTREHEYAARQYGSIRRDLAELGAVAERPRTEVQARLTAIKENWDQTSAETPNVPSKIWKVSSSHDYWPTEFDLWPEAKNRTTPTHAK